MNYASVADYAAAYCDAILVRCGVYSTTEECVDFAMANWFGADCVVASQESALECITWLEGLECTDEGWIDACDQAISCG